MNQRGFTFSELVVVISVFSITLVATTDIFMRSQRIQRRTAALERLQDDARYIMSKISSEVRAGAIEYAFYPSGQIPADGSEELALINFEGKKLRFKASSEQCPDVQSTPCVLLSDDGGTSWGSATSKSITVERLYFYITPLKDPFFLDEATNEFTADQQPRVTVVLALSAIVKGQQEPAKTTLQTTISTRAYKR
ncbi:MAG: type II secretion system protein [bacterium]|nr:type II secretion system protein [bacterium]